MLVLFPQLLSLSWFAAFMIRITLMLVFVYAGYTHAGDKKVSLKVLGVVEVMLAGLLLVGAWTQAVAILAAIITGSWLGMKRIAPLPLSTMLLAFVVALSLILTGSGPFAFDLPL